MQKYLTKKKEDYKERRNKERKINKKPRTQE